MKNTVSILSLGLCSMLGSAVFAQPEPTHKDVVYGEDPVYQSLDAYLADTDEPAIALIEIHGGGWDGGEKSGPSLENSSGRVQNYLDAGISVFSINYRLSTVAPWPAQEEDAARAVQFVRSKAREFNIDPERVAAIGGSAGAHIAMMLGMAPDRANPQSGDPVERQSSRVRCVVQKAGPVDLETMCKAMMKDQEPAGEGRGDSGAPNGKFLSLVGMTPENFDSDAFYIRLREISPIHNIRDDCPPIFIQYAVPEGVTSGDDPRLKWGAHSPISGYMLEKALKEKGLPYEMAMTPHLKDEKNVLTVEIQNRTIDFIKKYCGAEEAASER